MAKNPELCRRGFLRGSVAAPFAANVSSAATLGGSATGAVGSTTLANELLRLANAKHILQSPSDLDVFSDQIRNAFLDGSLGTANAIESGLRLLDIEDWELAGLSLDDLKNPLFDLLGAQHEITGIAGDNNLTIEDIPRLQELAKENEVFAEWLNDKNNFVDRLREVLCQLGFEDGSRPVFDSIQELQGTISKHVMENLSELKRTNPNEYKDLLRRCKWTIQRTFEDNRNNASDTKLIEEVKRDVDELIAQEKKARTSKPLWGAVWEQHTNAPNERIFHIKYNNKNKTIDTLQKMLLLPTNAIEEGKGDLEGFVIVKTPKTGIAAEVLGGMARASKDPLPPVLSIKTPLVG